eukprot:Nk52_evm57s2391 gene=Nk52_evmTU57s2391
MPSDSDMNQKQPSPSSSLSSNSMDILNYINGEFVAPKKGGYLDIMDPSTGQPYGHVPDSTPEDILLAVAAAKKAFPAWASTSKQARAKLLYKIADTIEADLERFAQAESRDQGKPVSLARAVDIPRACYNFRFFAGAILHQTSKSSVDDVMNAVNYETHNPVGVAALISPWNLPLYLLTWKIAPALAFGNTVVAKPSEFTSATAWMLCEVMQQCSVPAGVCNIVFGQGHVCGSALTTHPDVPLISFTGGTVTGKRIAADTAPFVKKLSLELGGKNAGIIFADADLDKCIPTTVRSSFANQGEICLCTSRLLVHRSIYDKFVQRFLDEVTRTVKVGNPSSKDTTMGALVSSQHLKKVSGYVQIALEEGATVHLCVNGKSYTYSNTTKQQQDEARKDFLASLPDANQTGYFHPPTVLTGLSENSRCMQEEIFGPVTSIVPFDTEEEAVRMANGTEYGLAASLWSQDVSTIHRVAAQVQAGTVWCNCWMVRDLKMPFGGLKQSGVGREGGDESREFFTEAKTICIKI